MKRVVESWLIHALLNPPMEKLLDLPKHAIALKNFTHEGTNYRGVDEWFEIESEGKRGQVTLGMLGQSGDSITAPGSVIRGLRQKGLVQLICDETLASGPYTVYSVENSHGFRPWDRFEQSSWEPPLPRSEFDDIFVPVRRMERHWPNVPAWSELFFLPWFLAQKAQLISEVSEIGALAIDLSSSLEARHERMVANAY